MNIMLEITHIRLTLLQLNMIKVCGENKALEKKKLQMETVMPTVKKLH
mgnify:CR=1 FL=1